MIQQEKHGKQSSATDPGHFPCTAAKYVKYGNIKLQCQLGISDQTAHLAQPSVHCPDMATSRQEQGGKTGTLQPTLPAGLRAGSRACTASEQCSGGRAIISTVLLLSAVPQAPVLIKCSAVTPKSFPRTNVATI